MEDLAESTLLSVHSLIYQVARLMNSYHKYLHSFFKVIYSLDSEHCSCPGDNYNSVPAGVDFMLVWVVQTTNSAPRIDRLNIIYTNIAQPTN